MLFYFCNQERENRMVSMMRHFPKSSRFLPSLTCLLLAVSIAATAFCGCANAYADARLYLPGNWNVLAELVTSNAENPNDPYAPKPGNLKTDAWRIQDSVAGPILTGSSGSVQGQYTNGGAVFVGTYPLGSGVYVAIKIDCVMDSTASMYGTNENDYWGTNTVTGEMIKLGIESWKFRATKQ
jgi:hypothetical protein